jgi:hypothetical protein
MSQMGRYVLSGLINIGALIVLCVASFWSSTVTLRDISSAVAIAWQPKTGSAESVVPLPLAASAPAPAPAELPAKLTQREAADHNVTTATAEQVSPAPEPPLPDETAAVGAMHPAAGSAGEGVRNNVARHTGTAMSQLQSTAAPTAAPVPKGSGTGHHRRHHHAHGSPVPNDVPVLSDRHDSPEPPRSTFLSAPNPNGGANS